jgi:hypothetical protein
MLMNMRTTWEAPTADPADRCVWSWGLSGPVPDGVEQRALADQVELSVNEATGRPGDVTTLRSYIHSGYKIIFHEFFDAFGGPAIGVIEVGSPATVIGTGTAAPSEVQLVVSRQITAPRGQIPIGRLYVGPVGGVVGARPTAQRVESFTYWAKKLHDRFVVRGYTPVVIAKAGTVLAAGKPIVSYKTDALWDTQRRRGFELATAGSSFELYA